MAEAHMTAADHSTVRRFAMRLEEAIVVLQRNQRAGPAEPVVLRVKYPEGSDPVARMRAAVGEFLAARSSGSGMREARCLSWGEALSRLSGWDWAAQELYVEALGAPATLNYDECPSTIERRNASQGRSTLAKAGTAGAVAGRAWTL